MSNEEIESQSNTTSIIAAKKQQTPQYTSAMGASPFASPSLPAATTASVTEAMSAGGLVEGLMSGDIPESHLLLATTAAAASALHSHAGDDAHIDLSTLPTVPVGEFGTFVPTVGQVFADFPEIEALLDAFARANSFMIIIMRSQRPGGHVVQATFGCYKSGSYRPNKIDTPNKRTIKTNCPFQINVRYSEKAGNYRITKVDLEHNHELDMSDVKSNIVKKSNKRRSSISAEGSLENANGEGLNGSSAEGMSLGSGSGSGSASVEGTPKTPKRPRKARKSKSSSRDTPVASNEGSASAKTTPFHEQTSSLSSDALSMSMLHEMSNGEPVNAMHHHHHHHHHHHLLLAGEEILGTEGNSDFDLLSGLELPEEIAQEVSAAMQYHMESHDDSANVSAAAPSH